MRRFRRSISETHLTLRSKCIRELALAHLQREASRKFALSLVREWREITRNEETGSLVSLVGNSHSSLTCHWSVGSKYLFYSLHSTNTLNGQISKVMCEMKRECWVLLTQVQNVWCKERDLSFGYEVLCWIGGWMYGTVQLQLHDSLMNYL